MDTKYPEPLSRVLRRTERRPRDRGKGAAGRYRTQPVTFSEIQEVDEENVEDAAVEANNNNHNNAAPLLISKSEHDISTGVYLSCPSREGESRPRKRTLKSINRLAVEGAYNSPSSLEDSDRPSQRQLSEPRPSI